MEPLKRLQGDFIDVVVMVSWIECEWYLSRGTEYLRGEYRHDKCKPEK
jgi:hypothetical protein